MKMNWRRIGYEESAGTWMGGMIDMELMRDAGILLTIRREQQGI